MVDRETQTQEILAALTEFEDESKARNEIIVKDLVSNRQLPSVIYHYTNDQGLRGILETGKFWLTDIFKLNDPSELEHGISHLIKALEVSGDSLSKDLARFVQDFRSKGLKKSARFFVCSFSSDGDELGQWRAYADNGRGFALGFDRKVLDDAFTNDKTFNHETPTFLVTYDDLYLFKIQKELVERLFLKIHGYSVKYLDRDVFLNKLLIPLIINSLYLTLLFKHKAYKNKQEYRFLQIIPQDQPPSQVKLRSRPYSLVRYREFDWRTVASKALTEIKIGPAADKEKAFEFVRDCFQISNIDPIEPTVSEIPYRAL